MNLCLLILIFMKSFIVPMLVVIDLQGTNTNKRRIIPEDERTKVMDLTLKRKSFRAS